MGQRQLQMNEIAARTNTINFPGYGVETSNEVFNWRGKRLYELGVITEMAPSTKPPGFYVNYSQVLFYLTVIAAIAGGFWFMYDRIADANYQRGVADAEKKQVERQLNDMQRELQVIKKINEANNVNTPK